MEDYSSVVDNLWSEIQKFDLYRNFDGTLVNHTGTHTASFNVFNLNLKRAFLPLFMRIEDSKNDYSRNQEEIEYAEKLPLEMVIVNLISAFEGYLSRIFLDILYYYEITDLNDKYRNKFINKFKIVKKKLLSLEKKEEEESILHI